MQKKDTNLFQDLCLHYERAGIRTPDNLIKSQVLYHLSYTPVSSYINHKGKCPEPESNQWHEDFQSSALPTELTGQKIAGIGFEPMTSGLWARRASRLLHPAIVLICAFRLMGGGGFEPPKQDAADLQSVPFGHSGNHPYFYIKMY